MGDSSMILVVSSSFTDSTLSAKPLPTIHNSTKQICNYFRSSESTALDWVSCGLVLNLRKENSTRLICSWWGKQCRIHPNMGFIPWYSFIRIFSAKNFVQMESLFGLCLKKSPKIFQDHSMSKNSNFRKMDIPAHKTAPSIHGPSFTCPTL